jgi:subtilisin family serine protease
VRNLADRGAEGTVVAASGRVNLSRLTELVLTTIVVRLHSSGVVALIARLHGPEEPYPSTESIMPTSHVGTLRALALSAIALALAACADSGPSSPSSDSPAASSFRSAPLTAIPGRYILLMKRGHETEVSAVTASWSRQLEQSDSYAGIAVMRNLSSQEAASLGALPPVQEVVQDRLLQWIPPARQLFSRARKATVIGPAPDATDQSDAFFFELQWHMQVTRAAQAWAVSNGGRDRLVCVLDTGVDPGHLDLAGKVDLAKSRSFIETEPFIEDLNLHGTFVSALVTSNGLGVASVASDAKLCAVKVLDVTGFGSFGGVINGILFASGNDADVINMSLGAYLDRSQPGVRGLIEALQRAINRAIDRGTVVVTSTGNNATNLDEDPPQFIEVPAQLDNVINAGATAPVNQQNFDKLASYSNFGGRSMDLVAPGGDLVPDGVFLDLMLSACSRFTLAFDCTDGVTYLFGAGTSAASPLVAATAAIIQSESERSPALVGRCIRETADEVGPFRIFGAGRLNVLEAAGC